MAFTDEESALAQELDTILNDPTTSEEEQIQAMELADGLFSASDQRDIEEFDARIKRDPAPERERASGDDMLHPRQPATGGRIRNAELEERQNRAAATGVDVNTGLDSKTRAYISAADLSPAAEFGTLDYLLREKYRKVGVIVPDTISLIQPEPETGTVSYLRMDEDGSFRPTLIDPGQLELGDIADMAGGAQQAAQETIGALGGITVGGLTGPAGAVAGGSAGAGVGAAAGVDTRRDVLEALGVPERLIRMATDDKKTEEVLWAMSLEGLIPMAMGSIRWLRNTAGRFLDEADYKGAIKSNVEEMQAAAKRLRDRGFGTIDLTPGQVTRNPEQLIREAEARGKAVGDRSVKLNAQEIRVHQQSTDALDAISAGTMQGRPTSRVDGLLDESTGIPVQEKLTSPRTAARDDLVYQEQSMETLRDSVDSRRAEPVYTGMQRQMEKAKSSAEAHSREGWNDFRAMVEFNPGTHTSDIRLLNPPNSALRKAVTKIARSSGQAYTKTIAAAKEQFLGDIGYAADSAAKGKRGNQLGDMLSEESLDMEGVHAALSHLKSDLRKMNRQATDAPGYNKKDLSDLIKAVESQIDNGALMRASSGVRLMRTGSGTRGIRESWRVANERTADMHRTFSNDSVKKVLEKDSKGRFKANDVALEEFLFNPKNNHTLTEVLDVAGSNPQIHLDLTKQLEAKHRREVYSGADNKFNLKAHQTFMDKHAQHFKALIGEEATSGIRTAEDIGTNILKAEKKLATVKTRLRASYGKDLTTEDLYAGNIANDLMKAPPAQIDRILRALPPPLRADVERETMAHLRNKILKSSGGQVNLNTLNKMLDTKTTNSRLGALFGRQYVKDLEDLRSVVKGIDAVRGVKGQRERVQPLFVSVTRTIFGALADIQRRITAGVGLGQAVRNRAAVNALMNPKGLESWMKLRQKHVRADALVGAAVGFFGEDIMSSVLATDDRLRQQYFAALKLRVAEQSKRAGTKGKADIASGTAMDREKKARGIK